MRELKDFKKISLEPGKVGKAKFMLGATELGYYMPNGEYIIEKGKFDIYIGENALTNRKIEIEIK